MKKLLLLVFLVFLLCGCKDKYSSGLHHIEIVVENYGVIKVELDADAAPITVSNFINIAKSGSYNGTTFHRIIKGFMIQGGIISKNSKTIKGEFSQNGVENNISHKRGVISMARPDNYDGAATQFFIVQEDTLSLDGLYAAFGHVTEGMEVVDAIANDAVPINGNGIIETSKRPVIKEIKVID